MLERFFEQVPGLSPYEWDDFENTELADSRLERWRQHILREIGPHVAPMTVGDKVIVTERATRIIAALKKDEDAHD